MKLDCRSYNCKTYLNEEVNKIQGLEVFKDKNIQCYITMDCKKAKSFNYGNMPAFGISQICILQIEKEAIRKGK